MEKKQQPDSAYIYCSLLPASLLLMGCSGLLGSQPRLDARSATAAPAMLPPDDSRSAEVLREGMQDLKQRAHDEALVSLGAAPGIAVAQGDLMGQGVRLGQDGEFTLECYEFDPVNGRWSSAEFTFQAEHPIEAVAARQPYEIYLAYQDPATRECVVEKWSFMAQQGARVAVRPAALNPIGVPLPYQPPSQGILGGAYIPMGSRPDSPVPFVSELYRGVDMSSVEGVQIDPEHRFLLVASTTDATLHQIPLSGPGKGQAMLVADVTSVPALSLSGELMAGQHGTNGRLYLIETLEIAGIRTLLRDINNDGVLDDATVYLPDDWESAGYEDGWIDDFTTY